MKQLGVCLFVLTSMVGCINMFAEDGLAEHGRRLCLAAQGHNKAAVSRELAQGANVNYALPDTGWTALMYAVWYGDLTMVSQLLRSGAKANLPYQYDQTPLHLAAHRGAAAIVKALLAAGADLHAKDRFGDTPLHKAARNAHSPIVSILLAAGAQPNARNKNSQTPLHQASSSYTYNPEVVRLLLDAGADRDAVDKTGKRPTLPVRDVVDVEHEGSAPSWFCATVGWCR